MNAKPQKPVTEGSNKEVSRPFCGIIMPIATMGQYEKSHWDRVRIILNEAIEDAGYSPRLVSESEDIGVIHARIVQNLYDDPIVVCDVSGKNANVMFELGLRLAFDKPTIVIKDDQTDYSFDTSPVEHIGYRADLRFDDVRDFKKRLSAAIKGSIAKKEKDESYSPFLGHFGKFKLAGIDTKTVSSEQFIIEQLQSLKAEMVNLSLRVTKEVRHHSYDMGEKSQHLLIENCINDVKGSSVFDFTNENDLQLFSSLVQREVLGRNGKISRSVIDPYVRMYVNEMLRPQASLT
ncbi:hypothetical protein [Rhizobium nepotum]|uniref:hypothetical protein n=1 Tax=Rhizobium nepotum TaxID=1035271 RepID=UPI000696E3B3|nr:hypothetical protein [Rhizobium nepotum]